MGPYSDFQCTEILNKYSFGYNAVHHPGPYHDITNNTGIAGTPYYACNSVEQLLSWWHNDACNEELEAIGAKIVIYEVPDAFVATGNKQVAFIRSKAKKVGTMSISAAEDAMFHACM